MNPNSYRSVSFADRLRALRERRKLSPEDLDTLLGFALGTTERWENQVGLPSVDLQQAFLLADCFRVSLDQLLRGAPLPDEPAFPRELHRFLATAEGRRANQLNVIGVLIELPCIPSVELYGQVVATLEPFIQAIDGAAFAGATDGLHS